MKPRCVEAFICPHCNTIHLDRDDCNKCIIKCEKKIQAELKRQELEAQRLEKFHELRLTAESFHDIAPYLENRAHELGHKLSVSISGSVRMNLATHDHLVGEENFDWSNKDEAYRKRHTYPVYMGRVSGTFVESKQSKSLTWGFTSFLDRHVAGLHTGTGGGGDQFGYEFRAYIQDFPKINAKYLEFQKLSELKLQHDQKEKLRYVEYEEYFEWKKFSDILWAVHNKELQEVRTREIELIGILQSRALELDKEEREERTKVIPPKELDLNKYNEFKSMFGK